MSAQKLKPLILYTANTPNGVKVSAFTEELKARYGDKTGFDVEYKRIDISKNTQKEPWFLKINPNGRIPALVDPNRNDTPVFESAAILLYLEKHYDPDHLFSWPSDSPEADDRRSEILQWMFFVHGGIGPMFGQSNHFNRYAPEDIPYAKNRYRNEAKRLLEVLALRLDQHEYLVGDRLTIADINALPWVYWAPWSKVPPSEVPPSVKAWVERLMANKAIKDGFRKPNKDDELSFMVQHMWDDNFEEENAERIKAQAAEATKWIVTDQNKK